MLVATFVRRELIILYCHTAGTVLCVGYHSGCCVVALLSTLLTATVILSPQCGGLYLTYNSATLRDSDAAGKLHSRPNLWCRPVFHNHHYHRHRRAASHIIISGVRTMPSAWAASIVRSVIWMKLLLLYAQYLPRYFDSQLALLHQIKQFHNFLPYFFGHCSQISQSASYQLSRDSFFSNTYQATA